MENKNKFSDLSYKLTELWLPGNMFTEYSSMLLIIGNITRVSIFSNCFCDMKTPSDRY